MEPVMHDPIIDYLSFSIPFPRLMTNFELSFDYDIGFSSDDRTFDIASLLSQQTNWTDAPARGVYEKGVWFPDIGIAYFEGGKSETCLVQITGQGCELLRQQGVLQDVCRAWEDRITRIDVAADFTCDVEPQDFAYAHSNARFKVTQFIDKNSGTTFYVGSKQSDRFARVYRYRDPHPRSAQLRCEVQFSGKQAKFAVSNILKTSVLEVFGQIGNTIGWNHPVYVQGLSNEKIRSAPRPTTKGNTIFWLYKAVLPSLRKQAAKGDIDTLLAFQRELCAIIDEYQISKEDREHVMA